MNVIVTGANRGIGLELVRQLLAQGHEVEATCRRPGEAKELRTTGAHVHVLDITNASSVAAFARTLSGSPIDLLINNAGTYGGPLQRMEDFDYAAAMRAFDTNALGALRMTQAFLPNLRLGINKKVAHLTSGMGSISGTTSPGDLGYRMSKVALNMVSRSIALEMHDDRIISIVIDPGWVRTEMGGPNATLLPGESVRGILAQIEAVSLSGSGGFVDFQGRRLDW